MTNGQIGKHGVETKILLPSKSLVKKGLIFALVFLLLLSAPFVFAYFKQANKAKKPEKPAVAWSSYKNTENIVGEQKFDFPLATRLMGFENAIDDFSSNITSDALAVSEPTKAASQQSENKAFSTQSLKNKVILIDPGHGDRDNLGAMGPTGLRELEVVLAVSKELKKMLENDSATVQLTRESSISELDNRQRGEMANEIKADIFIRVHADKWAEEERGFQVMWYKDSSKDLAKMVEEALKTISLPSRGVIKVYSEGFDVSEVPSVSVDVGNINNVKDEVMLKNKDMQKKIAATLHMAVKEYLLANFD